MVPAKDPEHLLVNIARQICGLLQRSGRMARERHERQQGPVADQKRGKQRDLAEHRQVEQGQRSDQVTDRNRLQRIAIQLDVMQVVFDHLIDDAAGPKQDHAAKDPPIGQPKRSVLFEAFGHRERHRRPDHEEKHRHNHVPDDKTRPSGVGQLRLREVVKDRAEKRHDCQGQFPSAHDPEHREAAEGIQRQ